MAEIVKLQIEFWAAREARDYALAQQLRRRLEDLGGSVA